ncbi:hypothetical protein GWI34_11275 [Actinomadura sp. DSM 109109]|nr:hypothetical protein [Actinomadura lepetitiana]
MISEEGRRAVVEAADHALTEAENARAAALAAGASTEQAEDAGEAALNKALGGN